MLFWDGLPAHRAKTVSAYMKSEKQWLRPVRFPAYAPELNPVEYLWAAMKKKYLAHLPVKGLPAIKKAIRRSKLRMARNTDTLFGFLKASRLFR